YHLVPWTLEQADQLIAMLEVYADDLLKGQAGYHDSGIRYIIEAQSEALYRFPGVSNAHWAWDLAYNLAQMGSEQASDAYAAIIIGALNTHEANPETLQAWFAAHETNIQLNISPMNPLPNVRSSFFLELTDHGFSGSYFWLVETGGTYQIYPLKSDWDFGFVDEAGLRFSLQDVTGDSIAEALTTHLHILGTYDNLLRDFDVFDLSQIPPKRLTFVPSQPLNQHAFETVLQQGNTPILRFEEPVKDSVCPATFAKKDYKWNGNALELFQQEFLTIDALSNQPEPQYQCINAILYRLLESAKRGEPSARQTLAEFIPVYPFSSFTYRGEPYPPDIKDEMYYQLAIWHAFAGEKLLAQERMAAIVANPAVPDSQWIARAQTFLQAYQDDADLVTICAKANACYPFLELPQLHQLATQSTLDTTSAYLQQAGMPVVASGNFDLGGGLPPGEWLLVEDDGFDDWVNFWIITQTPLAAYQVTSIYSDISNPFVALFASPVANEHRFTLHNNNAQTHFLASWDESSEKWDFEEIDASCYNQKLGRLNGNLFAGTEPTQISADVQAWQREAAGCGTDCHLNWEGSYYLLGLAHELAGEKAEAVAAYLHLWQTYPNSPYALMAQAKLQPVP
ncbi:MAG: hypothetical protein KDE56_29030, partial [Anaerolineales bacterium]|nr:hypothetical protein [Anaerolineales bacterium]